MSFQRRGMAVPVMFLSYWCVYFSCFMLLRATNATCIQQCLPMGLCILNLGHPCSFFLDYHSPEKDPSSASNHHLVHLAGAVSLQDGDLVGELLANWVVSSPHTRRQFVVAVRLAQPSCVQEVQEVAMPKCASEALPQDESCELILNLHPNPHGHLARTAPTRLE